MSTSPTTHSRPPRVLLFGTGGVGCVYTYILTQAGCEVTTVCRSNYTVVKQHGITIRSKIFGNVHVRPFAVVRSVSEAVSSLPSPSNLGNDDEKGEKYFDYVLICAKAFPGTSKLVEDAVTGEKTAIVLAQNGIGIEEEYVRRYPRNTVISGVVYLPTTQVEPGTIQMAALEVFEIGLFPAVHSSSEGGQGSGGSGRDDQRAQKQIQLLAQLWKKGRATCVVYDDVQPRRWTKVSVNASWNPVCALTMCDDANFLRSSTTMFTNAGRSPDHGDESQKKEDGRDIYDPEAAVARVMREVARIASAAGYPNALTEEAIQKNLQRAIDRMDAGGIEPSMLTDIRHNRPTEIEAIVGNTIRIGRKFGVNETPYLDFLYVMGKARNYAVVRGEGWKDIPTFD